MSIIRKNAKAIAIISVAAIAFVATIVSSISVSASNQPSPPAKVHGLSIVAEKDSIAGVERDSGFVISSPEAISVAEFKDRLSIVPAVGYKLQQRSSNELYINITGKLEADTVYNILIADNSYEPPQSWAFQTKNNFRITGTLPADKGKYVPVKSGIELYFSQPVDDISKSVTISPALTGKFKQFDDKTVIFMSAEGMEYDTVYTVTLAADIQSRTGDTLLEEYSFRFKTESSSNSGNRRTLYPYDGLSETFTSTDPIFIKLYAESGYANKEANVAIYRYPELDGYLTALDDGRQRESDFLPVEELEKVIEYTEKLLMNNDLYWNIAFLPLPENPGPGWYLVDIKAYNNQHTQKLLQITDIAVYSQTANGQMLFWLNDAENGQPIAGAKISVEGQEAVSDKNGLALLNIPVSEADKRDKDVYYYYGYYYYDYAYYYMDPLHLEKEVRIRHGERLYGGYLDLYDEKETSLNKLYYTYIYTDREAYQPDDTINFWGMILPRKSNSVRPERIVLDWTDGGKYPDGITVEVKPDGTFRGEIKLEKHVSGWEPVVFTLDGKTLARKSVTILEYVKPIYKVDVEIDKKYYRKNDKVGATVIAGFYDGTPARDIGISLSFDTYRNSSPAVTKSLQTDENGRAQADFSLSGDTSWYPRHDRIFGKTNSAEDRTVYIDQSVLVFPSDYMLQSSTERTEDGFTLALEGYSIDFDLVDRGEYNFGENKKLRGAKADIEGTGTIYQVEYVKNKIGEYYDFVNKVTVDRYKYERRETRMETFPIQMENGSFTSQPFNYPKKEATYYFIKINYTTPDGQRLEENCNVWGYREYYDRYADKNYKSYYFKNDSEEANYYDDSYYYYYHYRYSYGSYGINEKIEMHLSDQNEQIPDQGRILYTVIGKELLSYTTANAGCFSLNFKAEYIPNAVVVGAYFDGKHIFSVASSSLYYRYEDSTLNIEITPDKERYKPGDEVSLSLRVTNRDGKGRAANYLLSVVDEAAFAIREQNIDPLKDIYSRIYIDYKQYASYIQPYDIESGAEAGEGGGDSVRKDFLDTIAFLSGKTDSNGRTKLKFKLADNITSWRLTSIAFCDNVTGGVNIPRVGKDVSNIESGLPFFINQVLNEKYLDGDSVGLTLRGAGSAVSSSDVVEYEVNLSGGDVDMQKTAEGQAGDFCMLDFGRLPIGTYKVLMRASSGDYSDAIEKEIEVVDSLLLTSRNIKGDLKQGINVSAKRFPVSITLYDIENTLYYDILHQMLYAFGQRADQKIARALAGKRLNEINAGSKYPEKLDIDGDEAYFWRNGLRLFPYAEADVLLTAKAAAVAPEFLDEAALADYFMRVVRDNDSAALDVAAAYMGLGALKKPVLLDLRKLFTEARTSEASTLEEKLYLAAGLALLGDSAAVYEWYEETIHGELTQEGNALFYKKSGNMHKDYRLTAAAAMLACFINHPDHQQLLQFLVTRYSSTYTPLLELAAYVGKYSPKPDSPAVFSYQLAGETKRQAFDKKHYLNLELGETELAEADFQVLEGSIGYTAYYFGGFDEAEKTLPYGVGFNRQSAESVKLGNTVTVTNTITFSEKAPVGVYHVSQIVPSGLRLVKVNDTNSYLRNWYCRVGESGMLDFYIFPLDGYRSTDAFGRASMPRSVTFSYEIRAVLPGSYIMEASAISYSGSNTLYAGERSRIEVKE